MESSFKVKVHDSNQLCSGNTADEIKSFILEITV